MTNVKFWVDGKPGLFHNSYMENVPRIGELCVFSSGTYEVIEVTWVFYKSDDYYIEITLDKD